MTPLVLYQTVHLGGLRPRFVRQHITLLDHTSRALFGRPYTADAESLSQRLTEAAEQAGHPHTCSSFVRIELSAEGERIVADEVSLYDGYVLRYVKPTAATVTCDMPLSYAPTSARAAVQQLADLHANGASMAVCCDLQGRMIMADNAPVMGIRTKRLYLGAELPSVERAWIIAMSRRLQLECAAEPLTRDMAADLDELFYVDHRGITAFESCDGHPLMSLRAERIARAMEQPFQKK